MTCVSGRIRHFPSASGGVHVPAFLVVALFLLAGHAWAQITCPYTLPDTPGDEDLLKKFYCETGGPNNWRNKTGWGNTDLTAWDGVTVQQGRITQLRLQSNNLIGSIPSELGSLTSLEQLILNNNELSGEIPSELGMLTSLQWLHLHSNSLTGSIPSEFGMMTGLERLFLFGNELSGEIPDLSGMTSLQLLALDQNRLSGEIPSEFGTMTSLQLLYLHENQLSGEIPDLSGMTSLQQLYLSNNQLSGEIPSELGTMTSLQRLYLSNNQLSGEIPDLSGMTSLRELILNDNCALTGELPPGLMNLSGLATLNLERTGVSVPADQAFRAWLAGISFTSSSCPPPPPPPSPPPPPPPPESDCEALTEDRGEDGLAISPGCVGTSLVVISREEGKYITVELSVEGDQEHDEVPSIILSFSLLERIEAVSFALSIPSQEELPEGLSIDIMGSHDYGLIRLEGFTAEVGIGDVALGEGGTVTVCLPAPAFEEEEGSMPKLYRYEKGWNPLSGSRMDAVNDIESVCADTSSLPSLLGVFVEIPEPPEEEGDGVCCCSVVSEGDGESVAFNLLLIIISLLAFSLRRRKACVRGFM